jgi:peptidyl-prolyl cis-trans isomerase SurA
MTAGGGHGRLVVLLALAALAVPAAAQHATLPVDRIVAIVGIRPILTSQLEERLVYEQSQGMPAPPDSAAREALKRELLRQMIDEELLVQQAERDTSIKVTDQEVQDAVERSVQQVRSNYPSEQEFQAQLRAANFGSIEEWRRFLAENQHRAILRQRLLESLSQKGKLKPIPPTEAQMRVYWEANRAQLPKRPPVASFRQIVIAAMPDSAALVRAQHLCDSLLTELRHGADFATVARRFSGDSGSAVQGGELGWFRRGLMVKAFEQAAFNLRPGELSECVATEFGFHIIQSERVQPAEIQARQILIAPVISAAQIEKAHQLADSVRGALVGGAGASFDLLARRYADETETKLAEQVAIAQLPPAYQQLLARDSTPGWKPVLRLDVGHRTKFAVVEITKRLPEGDLAFDDVKDKIRANLSQELAVQHYLDLVRHQTYVDVRF